MHKKTRGFTLIELMVMLAVIAIVAVLGLPRLQGITDNNRLAGQINTLTRDLSYARSEAITRGTSVRLTSTAGTTAWEGGWTVDVLAADGVTVTATLRTTSTLTGNTPTLTGSVNTVTYLTDGSQSIAANITFDLCDGRTAEQGRRITVLPTGRPSLAKRTCT